MVMNIPNIIEKNFLALCLCRLCLNPTNTNPIIIVSYVFSLIIFFEIYKSNSITKNVYV